jgi:hypothetical protein
MMLRLDKIIKSWKDAEAQCDQINLYGFWDETTFLTKWRSRHGTLFFHSVSAADPISA